MAGRIIEMHPVSRITIDAVGPPGQRVFLLQASQGIETVTLKLEKEQARVLAQGGAPGQSPARGLQRWQRR